MDKNKKGLKNKYTEGLSLSDKIVKPKREWFILMTIFLSSILFAIGFNVYMYLNITSGEMYVSVNKEELIIEDLKEKALDEIVNKIDYKKNNFSNLKIEKLLDPSI